MHELNTIIIGAGLGGLTLARSLQNAGINFQVFERDAGPFERPQGYRLHLDADAINAAKEVLSPEFYRLFEATSQWTEPYTTILGQDLSVLRRVLTDDDHGLVWGPREGPPLHANVDRATLRQILLAGLEDRIQYGKKLASYESGSEGVIAHFTDGPTVKGQVLVGADGIRSAVKSQRAPSSQTLDAGITAIYGRIPYETASACVPTETLNDIFTIATDPRNVFLGLGSVRFPMAPDLAVETFAPGTAMRSQADYVVCIVGGRHEFFPERLRDTSRPELQQIAAQTIHDWPGDTSALVRSGDPSAFFLVDMYTSVPCVLDPPKNVTLLGDAIHAMTPTLGRGANVAMRDGALLGRRLKQVANGEETLFEALLQYEREMLDYGFEVVREAARIGEQRMAQNPLPT